MATSFTGLRCSMFHSQSSPAGLWLRAVICAKAPKIEQPSELPMVAPPVRATVGDAVAHFRDLPQLRLAAACLRLRRQPDRHAKGVLSARRGEVTGGFEVRHIRHAGGNRARGDRADAGNGLQAFGDLFRRCLGLDGGGDLVEPGRRPSGLNRWRLDGQLSRNWSARSWIDWRAAAGRTASSARASRRSRLWTPLATTIPNSPRWARIALRS